MSGGPRHTLGPSSSPAPSRALRFRPLLPPHLHSSSSSSRRPDAAPAAALCAPTAPRPSPPSSPSPRTSTAASRLSAALARAVSVAIAGAGYCVVAADTRLSVGYSVLSRDHSKIISLADKCVLASSGFQGDIKALQKNLVAKELEGLVWDTCETTLPSQQNITCYHRPPPEAE